MLPSTLFAGELDITTDYNLDIVGNEIRLSDYVWHMASWDRFVTWMQKRGSTKARWTSDEETTPFDSW